MSNRKRRRRGRTRSPIGVDKVNKGADRENVKRKFDDRKTERENRHPRLAAEKIIGPDNEDVLRIHLRGPVVDDLHREQSMRNRSTTTNEDRLRYKALVDAEISALPRSLRQRALDFVTQVRPPLDDQGRVLYPPASTKVDDDANYRPEQVTTGSNLYVLLRWFLTKKRRRQRSVFSEEPLDADAFDKTYIKPFRLGRWLHLDASDDSD